MAKSEERFHSVAVVGAAGQVGELFTRTLARNVGSDFSLAGVLRSRRLVDADSLPVTFHNQIGGMLADGPEMVILATPNPTEPALKELARHAQQPLTLVLPQNGVEVVPTAQRVLAEAGVPVTLVRASLFTNVSRDSEGRIVYRADKNRIALAPIGGEDVDGSVRKTTNLFKSVGFEVKVVPDYRAMEWAKLVANLFGSTSTVTGLTPLEALSDKDLFTIEHQALQDRFRALEAAGIAPANLWGMNKLRWLSRLGGIGRITGPIGNIFRGFVAQKFAAERNNQPSSAARQIEEGATKVEATEFYHRPMTKLANKSGLESPADWAIVDILKHHGDTRTQFSLNALSNSERRNFLMEIHNLEKETVFVRTHPALRLFLRAVLKGMYRYFSKSSEVKGQENLANIAEILRSGKSVLMAPLHVGHSDHIALIKALEQGLPAEARGYSNYFLANRRFAGEPLSAVLGRAYDHPVVWTVSRDGSEDENLKARIFNRRSKEDIDQKLEQGPSIVTVYLEGGRNKTPDLVLQRPALNSSLWVLHPRIGAIVPVVIRGTENMLPPGRKWPNRADVSVEFCEPIDADQIRKGIRGVPRDIWDDHFVGKYVFAAIAARLPESRRGGY